MWSEFVISNSPFLTNIAQLVPSRFNPGGILLNVVFFVYGPNRPILKIYMMMRRKHVKICWRIFQKKQLLAATANLWC